MENLDYAKRVISQYKVDLTPLQEIDRDNLFLALNTILTNISKQEQLKGKKEVAKQIGDSINKHETIYEIAANMRDILSLEN